MALFVTIAICAAVLAGMTTVVYRRQRQGTGSVPDGRGHVGTDSMRDQWQHKAHMGGGGGHQGANQVFGG